MLARLPQLRVLDLHRTVDIDDRILSLLYPSKSLRVLNCRGGGCVFDPADGAAAESFAAHPYLRMEDSTDQGPLPVEPLVDWGI